jgi:hypothetical protein
VREDSIDWIAQRMQQLVGEGLIVHGAVNGGVREPAVWDGPESALVRLEDGSLARVRPG